MCNALVISIFLLCSSKLVARIDCYFLALFDNENFCIYVDKVCTGSKVNIEKSRSEVSPMGQDTIENVSWPIKNLKCFYKILYVFDTSKCATFIRNIFEVYGGFIGQKILKL